MQHAHARGSGAHHEGLADVELDEEDLGLQAQHVALLAHLDAIAVVQVWVHPALVTQHYRRCVPAGHENYKAPARLLHALQTTGVTCLCVLKPCTSAPRHGQLETRRGHVKEVKRNCLSLPPNVA